MTRRLLKQEEIKQKQEFIAAIEDTLHARGLQCDQIVGKLDDKGLEDIIKQARIEFEKRKKKKSVDQEQAITNKAIQ